MALASPVRCLVAWRDASLAVGVTDDEQRDEFFIECRSRTTDEGRGRASVGEDTARRLGARSTRRDVVQCLEKNLSNGTREFLHFRVRIANDDVVQERLQLDETRLHVVVVGTAARRLQRDETTRVRIEHDVSHAGIGMSL
jgi:hypothetical protein